MASCIVLAVLRHTLIWGAVPCSMSSPSLKVLVCFVMSNAAWNPLLSLVVYLYLPYYTLLAAGLRQLKVLPRHSALTLCVVRVFSRTADFFETSVPVCVGLWGWWSLPIGPVCWHTSLSGRLFVHWADWCASFESFHFGSTFPWLLTGPHLCLVLSLAQLSLLKVLSIF